MTDRMLAADSRALADVYNKRSLPSIIAISCGICTAGRAWMLVLPFFCFSRKR